MSPEIVWNLCCLRLHIKRKSIVIVHTQDVVGDCIKENIKYIVWKLARKRGNFPEI